MSHDTDKDWAIRPEIACLVLITLLGTLLRFYQLAESSLWYDEAASIYLGRFVLHPTQLFNHHWNTEAPLNAIITWIWYGGIRLLTDFPVYSWQSDFLIRLLPCLESIATIPLLYFVGKRLLNDAWAALIATFFFAISPFYIYYAQELRIYAFLVPAWLAALHVVLRALETGQNRHWLGVTLAFTVLLYAHFISVWLIFAFSVYFILAWLVDRKHIVQWTIANAAGLVLMAPALFLAFEMNRMVTEVVHQWYGVPTFKTMLITFKIFFAGYGPTVWAYWALLLAALALHFFGLAALARTRWRAALILAIFTWVPLIGNVIMWSMRDFSFYEHRLFVVSGVAAMLGMAAGVRALPLVPLRVAVLIVWAVLTAPMLRDYYQHRLHPIHEHRWAIYDKPDYRSAAAYIAENWQEGDLLVYPNHALAYPMQHYLGDKPQVRLGNSVNDILEHMRAMSHPELSEHHGLMPVPKEKATAPAKRLWYLETHGDTQERKPFTVPIRHWLDTTWRPTEHHDLDNLEMLLYTR